MVRLFHRIVTLLYCEAMVEAAGYGWRRLWKLSAMRYFCHFLAVLEYKQMMTHYNYTGNENMDLEPPLELLTSYRYNAGLASIGVWSADRNSRLMVSVVRKMRERFSKLRRRKVSYNTCLSSIRIGSADRSSRLICRKNVKIIKWFSKLSKKTEKQLFESFIRVEGFFEKRKKTRIEVYTCLSICSRIWRLLTFPFGIEKHYVVLFFLHCQKWKQT